MGLSNRFKYVNNNTVIIPDEIPIIAAFIINVLK
jgi:hypothetical protein